MSADSPAARLVAAYEQHTTTLHSRHTAEVDHRASAIVLEEAQCALPVYCSHVKSFTEGYNAGLADAVPAPAPFEVSDKQVLELAGEYTWFFCGSTSHIDSVRTLIARYEVMRAARETAEGSL